MTEEEAYRRNNRLTRGICLWEIRQAQAMGDYGKAMMMGHAKDGPRQRADEQLARDLAEARR
jgi:hypothetical protein